MKRLISIVAAVALAATLGAAPANAAFGLHDLGVSFTDMQAGSHPDFTNELEVNVVEDPLFGEIPDGQPRNLTVELPEGFAVSPTAMPQCTAADFLNNNVVIPGTFGGTFPDCPDGSAIGLVTVRGGVGGDPQTSTAPVYNLAPPPGVAARFGFIPLAGARVVIDGLLEQTPPYKALGVVRNITQMERFYSSKLTLWGNPASSEHDGERGICTVKEFIDLESCPANVAERPFVTLPRACPGTPLLTRFEVTSWQGDFFEETVESQDELGDPAPLFGCERVGFGPEISSQPTAKSASSPTGLDFELTIDDEGMRDPGIIAESDIEEAVVTLPEGITANPSQAEGLATCSESDLARETPGSAFGSGCPAASKIGSLEVESPLLEGEVFKGSLFIATPHANLAGDSLIAFYIVVKDPSRGVLVKLPAKVTPDPETGQLLTTTTDMPQIPLSEVRFHFREGGRSPLVTPSRCGSYVTKALFTPHANPSAPFTATAGFQITLGPGGGPCPPPGAPPFEPGFEAGSANPGAGAHSPFAMRLTRRDGDQDLTRFDSSLPPGMVAKLAGVSQCSDAQIAQAKARSGREELASPSCPANSKIGRIMAGAGVGSQLTYVPGSVYLAGPFGGAPLSVLGIVPAVAGPFDVGTVVNRFALAIDPRTAEVTVDGANSDPIPHILAGIPLLVRDIQVNVDREEFTLNPTSCEPFAVGAQIWGGGSQLFSTADDAPASRSARFQAADCARLGFKPRLSLKLKGGTKRGGHPALRGVFRPRAGDANLKSLVLRLPRSAFLDQAHIRTICTRVQFAAKSCPEGAIYGHARAFTPLLESPLEGPVYLRSSNHNLPDFVAALHGLIDVEAVARIDSAKGGIRATFSNVPDAPLQKVIVSMQGGKKGLIVNSTDICEGAHRANVRMSGHNGRRSKSAVAMRAAGCGKRGRGG